jgi:cytochrome c oxidase subunit 2
MFLMVPVLGVGVFAWAIADLYPMRNHWLPDNINPDGGMIDELFMFIFYLTGTIFIGTGIVLFFFIWKYDAARNAQPVAYSHGNHTLEIVWSILPAATLLFIAIYQMSAWANAKMERPRIDDNQVMPPIAEVTGRQFEWRIRYPGPNGKLYDEDDFFTVNELHLPVQEEVVLAIKSQDVLHSFFLPQLRVKQDVVPGMQQYIWFKSTRTGTYDIVCAELCGWGHYKMRGRVIFEPRDKFEQWLADESAKQRATEYTPASEDDE